MTRPVSWKEFAATEPALAEIGSALLFQFKVGLAFLATVRKDYTLSLHDALPIYRKSVV